MPQFYSEAAEELGAILDDFTGAYIYALYYTETGDNGQAPSDAPLHPNSLQRCITDCALFQAQHFDLLARYYAAGKDEAQAGHDFWLTRNGHGAGFWDRGLGEIGGMLTDAAKAFGDVCVTTEQASGFGSYTLYVE
jgi:hypothetical protein